MTSFDIQIHPEDKFWEMMMYEMIQKEEEEEED